jgi:hypothetical protein
MNRRLADNRLDSELRAASTLLDLRTQAAMEWMKKMTKMWDYGESPNSAAMVVVAMGAEVDGYPLRLRGVRTYPLLLNGRD